MIPAVDHIPQAVLDAFGARAELPLPALARAMGRDIKTLHRQREAQQLPVHIKGTGLARRHYVCTPADVAAYYRNTLIDPGAEVVVEDSPEKLPSPTIASPKIKTFAKPGNRRRGFIYFVSDGEFIKIGWSKNWRKRIAILQVSNPKRLAVLGVCTGTPLAENSLHIAFYRHLVSGEWHRSHQEILDHVARMKRVDVEETG